MGEFKKKTFEEFIATNKKTNIKPSFYYTNYQKVAEYMDQFGLALDKIGIVKGSQNFIEKFTKLLKENPEFISITPLFTAVRPEQLIVLNDKGEYVEKFNNKNVTIDQAIFFLKEVGFLKNLDKNSPCNLKSYFFGINVGLDSNGRKNRSGKTMEMLVGGYIKEVFHYNDFCEQINIDGINKHWNENFKNNNAKKKRFDFVIKKNNTYFIIETNFFNSSGSKSDINTRYISLENDLKKISDRLVLCIITDGPGVIKAKSEIEDVFKKIKHVYNIHDLQEGLFKAMKSPEFNKS